MILACQFMIQIVFFEGDLIGQFPEGANDLAGVFAKNIVPMLLSKIDQLNIIGKLTKRLPELIHHILIACLMHLRIRVR